MQVLSSRLLLVSLLRLVAFQFNWRRGLRRALAHVDGDFDIRVGFSTEDGTIEAAIAFAERRVRVLKTIPEDVSVTLIFKDDLAIREMLRSAPSEVLNMLLRNRLRVVGSFSALQLFNYFLSLAIGPLQRRMEAKRREKADAERMMMAGGASQKPASSPSNNYRPSQRRALLRSAGEEDANVQALPNPYLSHLSLEDIPRLKQSLAVHFGQGVEHRPELCSERPRILTEWHRKNGFETDSEGNHWVPELRQAQAFKHLMANRRPIIRESDLLAGTTTEKEVGVVLYPDAHGTLIWGELNTVSDRELNPYSVSEKTVRELHEDVLPYWSERNFREWVRSEHNNPLCQALDERFALYFVWKTVALSHTVPDLSKLLSQGTRGIIAEIQTSLDEATGSERHAREAMILCLEGLECYAENLAEQAESEAATTIDLERKAELEKIAEVCRRVPTQPARTLHEAVQALCIAWIGLHMENTNAGLSLGRLDQVLQPYFLADIGGCETDAEREACISRAVELVGDFFMCCTDHLPLVPDIGNYLFGGSSSDQAITLGGVTPEGDDAVNDMTYIFLKATELLAIRDPNVNARFHSEKNSQTYLRRLCEVNLVTAATPSLHSDHAVGASLADFGYPDSAINDWSATGCVEPTLSGRHMGHTGAIMMNMVAALEMALNDGRHPLLGEQVGPKTGSFAAGDFADFEAFFEAFSTQLEFLFDNATQYNNLLAEAHAVLRPSPLLSALIDGCVQSGRDATRGGARYNSTGMACIGLADVTDSLLALEALVFDGERVPPAKLKQALDSDFRDDPAIRAMAQKKVAQFGSGSPKAVDMAKRVARLAQDLCRNRQNFRGGPYSAGFWSMSNHVAFGTLAGALPSGRPAGKAFTPGLTPQSGASRNLLDNLRDVAGLDPTSMSNNMAFNVKIVPGDADDHVSLVDRMKAYVETYFQLGGMQMQMNVVTSETLRDAMAHPENYRNLLVRISGYNAYFVTLNPDMQRELIERAEYGLG